jgi:hypothetical protein
MKKMLAVALFGMLCLSTLAHAQFAGTGTTTLQLTVGPEAAIQINTATTALSTSTTTFANPYTGTTNFTYKIRTSVGSGTGNVTSQVTSDFTAATNGPSVASPPTAGDALTYTCTVAAPGTACSGTQTASTSASSPVASFGADAHAVGNAGSVAWSLTNDPLYPTGSYSATVTFTISAT